MTEVYRIVATRAAETPLATDDITDMCQAAYPSYQNISIHGVRGHLIYLWRRDRVQQFHGNTDAAVLEALGVVAPRQRRLYWRLSPSPLANVSPLADEPLYDDLPMVHDGREPFPVTDDALDAPWGAVLELTDSGRPGWWQRQGGRDGEWIPVERPGRRDT